MALTPLQIFRFQVEFKTQAVLSGVTFDQVQVCQGAFAECSGLEATMEPKVIKEGGRNYGVAQRAGGITFATVVLKRGIRKLSFLDSTRIVSASQFGQLMPSGRR